MAGRSIAQRSGRIDIGAAARVGPALEDAINFATLENAGSVLESAPASALPLKVANAIIKTDETALITKFFSILHPFKKPCTQT